MPRVDCVSRVAVDRTARVRQLEGVFDLPPAALSEQRWSFDCPIEARPWHIGLIVGPSGAGKSTVARALFGASVCDGFAWPPDRAVVDAFPPALEMRVITALLASVGFSSPPSWLRPFRALSTGEQFRVTLARALAEAPDLVVMDEFTSVVDRTVAQIGAAAVAKTVRRRGGRFVAVTCHEDVEPWLDPDWVCWPHLGQFQWRALHGRPSIALVVQRVEPAAWAYFHRHHYLSGALHRSARCFMGCVRGEPAAFTAVLPSIGVRQLWREHRTVCLPDFQGVGLGSAMSNAVAAVTAAATGGRYHSVTTHPAFIAARRASDRWREVQRPSLRHAHVGRGLPMGLRLKATFRYVGPPWPEATAARMLWETSFATANRMTQTRVASEAVG